MYYQQENCKQLYLIPFIIMDSKVKVFMVAEKASIARSIAEALAGRGKYIPRKGLINICPIMSWEGEFQGKKAEFHVLNNILSIKSTSVAGHIFNRDIPEQYQDWRKLDPIELFDVPTIKKVANPEQKIIQHLEQESKDSDYIILWLDCDREGENICYEVLEVVQKNLKKGTGQQIFRAKFSSITVEDIQAAFKGLKGGPNKNESLAVDARQIIDLKVGYAFTRLQSKHLSRKYEDLAQNTVSYGPCQTPTLAFCVDRGEEIKNFKPEAIETINATIELPDKSTFQVTCQTKPQPSIRKETEALKAVVVAKVEEKSDIAQPPLPLNTIMVLQIASLYLRLSPSETMQIAEHLYLQGFLTYPRTETTKYAPTFDFKAPLKQLEGGKLGKLAKQLISQGPLVSSGGHDAGDHPPITPTSKAPTQFENPKEEQLYDLVSRFYMASLAGPAKYQLTNIELQFGKRSVPYQAVRVIQPGFEDYVPELRRKTVNIPQLKAGQQLPIKSINIKDEQTLPPQFLTEVDLIKLMDQHRIGTDASLASHINTIAERKYVVVDPATRQLQTLKLGEAFILALKEIDQVQIFITFDQDLCSPKLRSNMEKMLDQIALGKADFETVLKQVLASFKEKYIKYQKNINVLDKHFDGVFQSVDDALKNAQLFSICGRCKNQMRLLQGKIFCEKCKCMLGLPKRVNYKRTNKICDKDSYEFILCEPQGKGESQEVCPACSQKAWKESQQQQQK